MLARLQNVLRQAQRGRYAVGAFNVSNLEQIKAVIAAGVALRSPVIINTSEKALDYAGIPELAAIVQTIARRVPIDVVLNLDHGRDVQVAEECLTQGWTGIMFDGSKLPYEDNVRTTALVKKLGQKKNVGVEGEIGQVKYKEDLAVSKKPVLATPEQAIDFVRRTKVDALAVGIGNSHGLPVPGERLHFDLLAKIHRAVRVPLVLHGASGTSPSSIKKAISLGICKINIDTDLRLAFTASVRKNLRDKAVFDPRGYLKPAGQAMGDVVKQKIIVFGSKGKNK